MDQIKLVWQERRSDSALIESVWMSKTLAATERAVIADPCMSIALVKRGGQSEVVVAGPKTTPFRQPLPAGHTCLTIRLKPGVFLRKIPTRELIDDSVVFMTDSESRFQLGEESFQFPGFDHAERFIEELYAAGYLGYDLPQNVPGQSSRTYSRHVRQITGLPPYRLYQLQRMHQALRLLKQGTAAADVAAELAFTDQAHLVHASKRFFGYTPKQLDHLPQRP